MPCSTGSRVPVNKKLPGTSGLTSGLVTRHFRAHFLEQLAQAATLPNEKKGPANYCHHVNQWHGRKHNGCRNPEILVQTALR